MNLLSLLQEKRTDFIELCQAHQVEVMYAFGSSITDRFNPQTSDIDLVVRVDVADPADRGETLLSLWDQLELLFERKVDLLTEASIKNPCLKKTIDRTKKVIYDRSREEVKVEYSTRWFWVGVE